MSVRASVALYGKKKTSMSAATGRMSVRTLCLLESPDFETK
jgi:hypothetical protein